MFSNLSSTAHHSSKKEKKHLQSRLHGSITVLSSSTEVSFVLELFTSTYLPFGLAQGSFHYLKGHNFWVLLFHISHFEPSIQYLLVNFLGVEFLSKYTVTPWTRIIPVMIHTRHIIDSLIICDKYYFYISSQLSSCSLGERHLVRISTHHHSMDAWECKQILIIIKAK